MTIKELFLHIGITNFRQARWGQEIECSQPGVYIISSSRAPEDSIQDSQPNFNDVAILKWINRLPEFTLDGMRPNVEALKKRLEEFWCPNETILYIGQTNRSISKRVDEYYKTVLGARTPHSGGQWLKTLRNIDSFYVYYAPTINPKTQESNLLDYFYNSVGKLPFANLEGPERKKKKHGLKGQRDSK